jgi:flagellin
MIINHNIAALNTHRQMGGANNAMQSSMEKLSSGLRINKAGDDAAGLAISEKMRGQIRGLNQAQSNAQDGISLIQTAEGAMNETHSILQRMRELAVQSSNDTATDSDRAEIQKEVSQLKEEIDRISNTTEFNTKKLLNGDLEGNKNAQGTKLNSVATQQVATNGTSLGGNALQETTSIVTGANDELGLKLTMADGTVYSEDLTLDEGNYTKQQLVDELNNQIGSNSNLAGNVTAQLTNDDKVIFVTNEQAAGAKIELEEAASGADQSAAVALGFQDAPATATGATALGTEKFVEGTSDSIDVTIGNKTLTVDFLDADFKIGTTGDEAELAQKIQDAINTEFGGSADANLVEVGVDTDNKLTFISTAGAEVKIAAGASQSATAVLDITADAANTTISDANLTNTTGVAADDTSASTTLISLGNSDGNSYGLTAGNVIKVSGTLNGTEFNNDSSALTVDSTTTVQDLLDEVSDSIPGAESVSLDTNTGEIKINGQLGEAYGIANLKITAESSATDNSKVASFTNDFSAFEETQEAQDTHTDSSLSFHIGANEDQTMKVDINEMSVNSLSLASVDVSTQQGAETAMTVINNAIEEVSAERSKLGAFQNRLEHTINNLGTSSENLTAAESRIRDVDMAKEMMNQTKQSILAQASQSMLAKANQNPQQVLQLLR